MYHLLETEMNCISAFNGEALRWFSIGSLCLSFFIGIIIGYAFSESVLSEFGHFMLRYGAPFLGILYAFSVRVWNMGLV